MLLVARSKMRRSPSGAPKFTVVVPGLLLGQAVASTWTRTRRLTKSSSLVTCTSRNDSQGAVNQFTTYVLGSLVENTEATMRSSIWTSGIVLSCCEHAAVTSEIVSAAKPSRVRKLRVCMLPEYRCTRVGERS